MVEQLPRFIGDARGGAGPAAVFVGSAAGRFVPGRYVDELISVHEQNQLRGAMGLWFDHAAVVGVRNETRGYLGQLLHLFVAGKPVFVMDELSVEWALHYGLTARLGGHPSWLCHDVDSLSTYNLAGVATTVKACFAGALSGMPMLILPKADGGPGCASQDSYAPVRRWAATYGVLDAVCNSEAEAAERLRTAKPFPLERLERERERARETLRELTDVASMQVVRSLTVFEPRTEGVDDATAQALTQALGGPRVIHPDDVFNPATHYDANYYAGPGGYGIRYPGPDHKWATYHGPARRWEGNHRVAAILDGMFPGRSESLLDIGCGTGDFVNCMAALGWEAKGVDISSDATRGNNRVVCADFADPAGEIEQGCWRLVTALDFWEHIFNDDVDRLIDATRGLLTSKGLHFAIICTHTPAEADFVAEPGVTFTPENAWLLVSGHVNVRSWGWWARKFREHGFKLRHDIAYLFQVRRSEDPGLSLVKSWEPKNLLVLEKI